MIHHTSYWVQSTFCGQESLLSLFDRNSADSVWQKLCGFSLAGTLWIQFDRNSVDAIPVWCTCRSTTPGRHLVDTWSTPGLHLIYICTDGSRHWIYICILKNVRIYEILEESRELLICFEVCNGVIIIKYTIIFILFNILNYNFP